MAFIPTPNAAKCVCRFAVLGKVYTNSLWFWKAGGWSALGLEELSEAALNGYDSNLALYVSDAVDFVEAISYDMSAIDGPAVSFTPAFPVVGTVASPILPGNVTLAVGFRTGGRGRSTRGRVYHVGLTESQVTGNSLVAGLSATLEAEYLDWLNFMETATGADHVVVSFQVDNVVRTAGYVQSVTDITVDSTIDTQRRRV